LARRPTGVFEGHTKRDMRLS